MEATSDSTIILNGTVIVGGTSVVLNSAVVKAFTFASTSPLKIATVPAGKRVARSIVVIDTPLDGGAPVLTVGDPGSTNRLHQASGIAPKVADVYKAEPYHLYASATDVNLYITPDGSANGAGVAILELI